MKSPVKLFELSEMSGKDNDVDLSCLHKATISYDYLHTNSTTHEFLFGAVAELVDNSRDAGAMNLVIDADLDKAQLSVLDDGCGMDREEAISVVSFGHSLKKMEQGMIGQYGNGLKSGALRIGNDFMLFTKKNGTLTCLLLSQTFHEGLQQKDIFVPTPSFSVDGLILSENLHRHEVEMDIICKFSPFNTQKDILAQFDKITGDSGTLVVVFNLRRIDTGELELDLTADSSDIRLTKCEEQREDERNSLRAYLAVLYINPRMKIYLRGEKVHTIQILNTLLNPYRYKYLAKNLKSCAAKELEHCIRKKKDAEDMLARAKSELGEFMNSINSTNSDFAVDKDARTKQRMLALKVTERTNLVEQCEKKEKEAAKAKQSPTPLVFYFGLNVHHRNRYGCMIYNNGRLIEMYERPPAQKEKNDNMMKCLGVVGLVDVPYSVLQPTHNKQGFENHRERQALLRALNDHMLQYWSDIGIGSTPGGIKAFWQQFGYEDSLWSSACSNEKADLIKRLRQTGHVVQCNDCLKWRHVDYEQEYMENGIPDDWTCNDHPNSALRGCSRKEAAVRTKEGRLIVHPKSPEAQKSSNKPQDRRMGQLNAATLLKKSSAEKQGPSNGRAQKVSIPNESSDSEEADNVRRVSRSKERKSVRAAENSRFVSSRKMPVSTRVSQPVKGGSVLKRRATTPAPRAVVDSSGDEEEEEEPVVVKKPKTKADLRRQLEAQNDDTTLPVAAASVVNGQSASQDVDRDQGSHNVDGDQDVPPPVVNNVSPESARNKQLEKERDHALSLVRRMILGFANEGSKHAGALRRVSDSTLLTTDFPQLTRNVLEELVKKPTREFEQKNFGYLSVQREYHTLQSLEEDLFSVLGWCAQSVPDMEVKREDVFASLKHMTEILRQHAEEQE